MRNVSDRSCREDQSTYSVFSNFFFSENCAVYEIMWNNVVAPAGHKWQYNKVHVLYMLDY